MSVQYKFFTISVNSGESQENNLNKFLKSVKIVTVNKEFVQSGSSSFWSFAVEYFEEEIIKTKDTSRPDYKEILNKDEFLVFSKLREWRKDESLKEGVPVYKIFTNAQIAEISKKKDLNISQLKKIDGIGDTRAQKYSDAVIKLIEELKINQE